MASTPDDDATARLAHLEAMRRLAMGAAHTLNNAFTAVMGETGFLQEDRKQDALVVEATTAILTELDRCTRITRGLLARRSPAQGDNDEVDLVRVVREVGDLLGHTIGSLCQLRITAPDDFLLVRGGAERLELLVLALVHYAADHAGGSSEVQLALASEPEAGEVTLRLQVKAQELPEYVVGAFQEPELAPDAPTRTSLAAIAQVVASGGGHRFASATEPDGWAALVRLPLEP